jgi:hypothetical protein
MAGITTLISGRGWIANALACALIVVLAPPILLSVVLALIPALTFLFVLFLTFALPLFLFLLVILILVTSSTNGGKPLSDLTSTPGLSTDENLSDLFADLEDLTDEIAGSSESSDDSSSILDVNVKIRLDKMKRDPEWKEKVTGWLTYDSMMMSDKMVGEWNDIGQPDETVFVGVDKNPDQYVCRRLEVIVEEEDEE